MDKALHEQGQTLQELLRQFRQATTTPMSGFILQTPHHKIAGNDDVQNRDELGQ
jgi:hypothetical protein